MFHLCCGDLMSPLLSSMAHETGFNIPACHQLTMLSAIPGVHCYGMQKRCCMGICIKWASDTYITKSCEIAKLQDMSYPDSKVHGANMGRTWVHLAPDGLHVGPMNLAIRVVLQGDSNLKGCQAASHTSVIHDIKPKLRLYTGFYKIPWSL